MTLLLVFLSMLVNDFAPSLRGYCKRNFNAGIETQRVADTFRSDNHDHHKNTICDLTAAGRDAQVRDVWSGGLTLCAHVQVPGMRPTRPVHTDAQKHASALSDPDMHGGHMLPASFLAAAVGFHYTCWEHYRIG